MLQRGEILTADDIPVKTVPKAQSRYQPIPEPAAVEPEQKAQARARQIRALPPSDRARTIGDLEGKAESMRRNVRAGYTEWRGELAIVEHTFALAAAGSRERSVHG